MAKAKLMWILVLVALLVSPAMAADVMLDSPIDSITFQNDVNGREYGRAIVTVNRELNGHAYTKSVPVMAFDKKVEILKSYAEGDTLRVVASYSAEYDSYTIQSFIRD